MGKWDDMWEGDDLISQLRSPTSDYRSYLQERYHEYTTHPQHPLDADVRITSDRVNNTERVQVRLNVVAEARINQEDAYRGRYDYARPSFEEIAAEQIKEQLARIVDEKLGVNSRARRDREVAAHKERVNREMHMDLISFEAKVSPLKKLDAAVEKVCASVR